MVDFPYAILARGDRLEVILGFLVDISPWLLCGIGLNKLPNVRSNIPFTFSCHVLFRYLLRTQVLLDLLKNLLYMS